MLCLFMFVDFIFILLPLSLMIKSNLLMRKFKSVIVMCFFPVCEVMITQILKKKVPCYFSGEAD